MPSEFFLTTERDPPLKRYCSASDVEGPLSTPGKNLTALLAQFAKGKYVCRGVSETVDETGESQATQGWLPRSSSFCSAMIAIAQSYIAPSDHDQWAILELFDARLGAVLLAVIRLRHRSRAKRQVLEALS